MRKNQQGFTLVELSIVLVILGLLVGGVLTGQSLIRAAELRSVTTERDKFFAAVQTFRDKYFALPGDMPNAYAFWGATCGTNDTTDSTGCNGSGDGNIDPRDENIKSWEHLSRAGLIEGSYDGTHTGGVLSVANTPASKFTQGRWDLTSYGYYVAGSPPLSYWPNLTFGQPAGDVVLSPSNNLKREEAWNIDTKTDDGRANTGKTRGYLQAGYVCNDTGTDYYSLSSQGSNGAGQCRLSFAMN